MPLTEHQPVRTQPAPPARRATLGRWAVTLAATVASAHALDAVAAAAGVALVASGLLGGAGPGVLVVLLLASYGAWALGLRSALRANWSLLSTAGVSTSAVSKAAHDLAVRRRGGPRARRFAAAAGYAGTEVAKEIPYYAGAFGASAATDAVSSADALIFLAGANLGAAGYEYALAAATRGLLGRRYASFETDWSPRAYLAEYYTDVQPDELETIAYFVDAARRMPPGRPALVFGTGPTLHHVFLLAERASEIHLGDYLPANLEEIRRWLERRPDAHDWRPFVRYTLTCEGVEAPTDEQVAAREELTRRRITRLLLVDGRKPEPLPDRYPTVLSAYCADSATPDRAVWAAFLTHVAGLVAPGGLFLTAALRRCDRYVVGGKSFPGANVDEHDLDRVLAAAFGPLTAPATARTLAAAHGYSGIVLATATRQ